MTEREQFELSETRLRVYARDRYICRNCGCSIYQHGSPQLAHRVPQTKANIRKYGKHAIHHDDNLASVCSLRCNAAVLASPAEEREIMARIKEVNNSAS